MNIYLQFPQFILVNERREDKINIRNEYLLRITRTRDIIICVSRKNLRKMFGEPSLPKTLIQFEQKQRKNSSVLSANYFVIFNRSFWLNILVDSSPFVIVFNIRLDETQHAARPKAKPHNPPSDTPYRWCAIKVHAPLFADPNTLCRNTHTHTQPSTYK